MLLFLVIISVVADRVYSDEPQCTCSKFHYEEQLLEKMIKTEMKFQALQEQLDAKLEGFTKTIEDNAIKTRDNMDSFKSGIEALMTKNGNKINSTQTDIQKMKVEVKASSPKPDVTFRAKKVADLTPQTGQVYVFTEVLLNTGSGYDETTGKFTAPVDGTYLFTCQLCHDTAKYLHYGIMLDGAEIQRGHFRENTHAICTSFDVITYMNSSQSLWIQGFHTYDYLIEDQWRWNMFSGVLLH